MGQTNKSSAALLRRYLTVGAGHSCNTNILTLGLECFIHPLLGPSGGSAGVQRTWPADESKYKCGNQQGKFGYSSD